MKEDNNFVSRVKRYSKVTTSLTSLATQFAGKKYLNFDLSDQKYAAQITEILGNLKGPLMKVAQLSATIPDLLPEEYARKLAELQSNAPPMSWVFVKRRMKAELGENWEDHFLSFDKEASFAASLGQVHKASLPNKDHVACKLQYPDMASAVEADLGQLKIIFKIYSSYNKSIQIREIYKEIEARLKEELDYRLEHKHLKVFNFIHQKNDYIKIPKVYEKISTNRLLVMQYLEGKKLIEYKKAPQKLRNELGVELEKYLLTLSLSSKIALIISSSVGLAPALAIPSIGILLPGPCCTDMLHTASCSPLQCVPSHMSMPVSFLIFLTNLS